MTQLVYPELEIPDEHIELLQRQLFPFVSMPEDREVDCWFWTREGCVTRNGYGLVTAPGPLPELLGGPHSRLAHAVSWALEHGRWPRPKYQLHHTCWERRCANPIHLVELPARYHARLHRMHRDGSYPDWTRKEAKRPIQGELELIDYDAEVFTITI